MPHDKSTIMGLLTVDSFLASPHPLVSRVGFDLNIFTGPATFAISGRGSKLHFLGAQHTRSLDNPMFASIRTAIAECCHGWAVIEGLYPFAAKLSEDDYRRQTESISSCDESILTARGGEILVAAKWALAESCRIICPEFTLPLLLGPVAAKMRLSRKSILASIFVSEYALRRSYSDQNFEQALYAIASDLSNEVGETDVEVDSAEILAGLEELLDPAELRRASPKDLTNLASPMGAQALNEVSRIISNMRDRFLTHTLLTLLDQDQCVFALYGSGHLAQCRNTLEVWAADRGSANVHWREEPDWRDH